MGTENKTQKRLLESLKKDVVSQISRSMDDVQFVCNTPDEIDKASNLEQSIISDAGRQFLQRRLQAIEAALHNINEGEYGVCEECGDDIHPARIYANPLATTCIDCQEQLEKDNKKHNLPY